MTKVRVHRTNWVDISTDWQTHHFCVCLHLLRIRFSIEFVSDRLVSYRLKTPPSNDALRHSGPPSRRWTSLIVTLYFDVELSRANRPGTSQIKEKKIIGLFGQSIEWISKNTWTKTICWWHGTTTSIARAHWREWTWVSRWIWTSTIW